MHAPSKEQRHGQSHAKLLTMHISKTIAHLTCKGKINSRMKSQQSPVELEDLCLILKVAVGTFYFLASLVLLVCYYYLFLAREIVLDRYSSSQKTTHTHTYILHKIIFSPENTSMSNSYK